MREISAGDAGHSRRKSLIEGIGKKVDRVIRRRKCLECGYKWNTVEVYAEDWERISRAGQ
ncbi:MAG: hypothetical protein ACLSBG_09380 [Sellimonas intestinalis]|uniref:hypothetical protein n=1 Tax=Sellimonas intestinalis TaxID=1653434 RepID=UPI00399134B7